MKRLAYIDALRGFGILCVVYHHLIVMGLRDSGYVSSINQVITTFFMPLFFFISGYVSYKYREWNVGECKRMIWNKTRELVIPFVTMFLFCLLYFDLDINQYLYDHFKCGFWFTFVAFQVIFIWISYNAIFRILHINKVFKETGIVYVFLLISFALFILSRRLSESNHIIGLLSLDFTCRYLFFFAFGICCKLQTDKLNKLLQNNYFITVLFIIAFLPINYPLHDLIVSLSRVLFIYACFYKYQDYFQNSAVPAKGLSYIGRHTLEIYLIHYFLLFRLDFIVPYLISAKQYCFRGWGGSTAELLIILTLAIVLSYASIFVRKIINVCPFISNLCFGPIK